MHTHHVVPKHAGGTDHPSNLTCPLTIEEHAEHHRYRYEMLGEVQDKIAYDCLSGRIGTEEARIAASRIGWKKKLANETAEERESRIAKNRAAGFLSRGSKVADTTKMKECKTGGKNPMAKVTPFQARVIRRLTEDMMNVEIAEIFSLHYNTISDIKTNKRWAQ